MAVQLMATAVTINNFIEQVQIVGDSANNVKGNHCLIKWFE